MKLKRYSAPLVVPGPDGLFCSVLILICGFSCVPAIYASPNPSEKSKTANGKEAVANFLNSFTPSTKVKSPELTFVEVAKSMDFDEMVHRSFGEAEWEKFTDAEKKELSTLFKKLIQIRYYPRWSRIFQAGHFDSKTEGKSGQDTLVKGTLKLDGKSSQLTFRLAKDADSLKLISMAIDEKDLLERTSIKLKRGLSRKGAKGLILHLRKKTSESLKGSTSKPQLDDLISGSK
ncbi:MAG: ABC transporter substrate-binding protein [Leptolyngbya sp.]|nr:ABC transporter substrate-binding protein [Candidatus Melainabacteria bacterium]